MTPDNPPTSITEGPASRADKWSDISNSLGWLMLLATLVSLSIPPSDKASGSGLFYVRLAPAILATLLLLITAIRSRGMTRLIPILGLGIVAFLLFILLQTAHSH